MSEATYGGAVGMYELSRIRPRQHLIDDLAVRVLVAARIGAVILDDRLNVEAMEAAWAKGHPDGFHATLVEIVKAGVIDAVPTTGEDTP